MTRNTRSRVTRPTTSPCIREALSSGSGNGGTFFTIGHSTRPLDAFIALLREANVRLIVDVRTVPRSRANPQYNGDVLSPALAAFQIGYEHLATLGGLRGKQRAMPQSVNGFWQNERFHNYADYAMSESFRAGLTRLRKLGLTRTCAIMCAEALWWRCHRRIISDYLLAANERVFHILASGQIMPAQMTRAAKLDSSGSLTYPTM
jgi:uncharacterized protein (DUF488 family)